MAVSVSDAYNFRKINDRVSTSGLLSEQQLRELAREGYEVVINLLPHDNEWAVPAEPDIVAGLELEYHSIPVDFDAPSVEDYLAFEARMEASDSRRLLVHCAANYRVSAFYALFGLRKLGWDDARAEEFIGAIWNLSEHPVWETFFNDMRPGSLNR